MAIEDLRRDHEEKRGKYIGLLSALTSLRCELMKLGIQGEDITYQYGTNIPLSDSIALPERMLGFNMKILATKTHC